MVGGSGIGIPAVIWVQRGSQSVPDALRSRQTIA